MHTFCHNRKLSRALAFSTMKAVALVLAVLCAGAVCRADQIYAVTGTMTITGQNVCGGPCVEIINFSYEVYEGYGVYVPLYTDSPYTYNLSILSGSVSSTSSGALGTYELTPTGSNFFIAPTVPGQTGDADRNYFGPVWGGPDDIELFFMLNEQPAPFVPTLGGDLYQCRTTVCVEDFGPGDITWPAVVTTTATLIWTPEPSTLALLLLGCPVLGLLRIKPMRDQRL